MKNVDKGKAGISCPGLCKFQSDRGLIFDTAEEIRDVLDLCKIAPQHDALSFITSGMCQRTCKCHGQDINALRLYRCITKTHN
jgi:hypothetical protein